jgi:AcrR family transcriptional regulator
LDEVCQYLTLNLGGTIAMKRKYNSQLREESARKTRKKILDSAVKLHGQGDTDFTHLAEDAGVSVPTIRKYFSTREELFRGCTQHFFENHELPSIENIAVIEDEGRRLTEAVRQLFGLHEATMGLTWLAFMLEEESPAMAEARSQTDAFIMAVAHLIMRDRQHIANSANESSPTAEAGFVTGMLSPLTYRALRLFGALTPEQAIQQTVNVISHTLRINLPDDLKR